jgi:hypothetical protein
MTSLGIVVGKASRHPMEKTAARIGATEMREEVGKSSTGDAEGSVVTGGLAVGESALLSERRSLSLLDGRTCAGIGLPAAGKRPWCCQTRSQSVNSVRSASGSFKFFAENWT